MDQSIYEGYSRLQRHSWELVRAFGETSKTDCMNIHGLNAMHVSIDQRSVGQRSRFRMSDPGSVKKRPKIREGEAGSLRLLKYIGPKFDVAPSILGLAIPWTHASHRSALTGQRLVEEHDQWRCGTLRRADRLLPGVSQQKAPCTSSGWYQMNSPMITAAMPSRRASPGAVSHRISPAQHR